MALPLQLGMKNLFVSLQVIYRVSCIAVDVASVCLQYRSSGSSYSAIFPRDPMVTFMIANYFDASDTHNPLITFVSLFYFVNSAGVFNTFFVNI